ncbi:MAG: response regulator [Alphaproteobacteria bacterium]|nr:response regulator [Alphaproteobacteria bacterium]
MGNVDFSELKALVIDDDEIMVNVTTTILHSLGIPHINSAPNGSEAFTKLRKTPFDLVVCDWLMVPMNGIEFCHQVRFSEDSPNQKIPILMMTSQNLPQHAEQARDAGVSGFIVKPPSQKVINASLHAIFHDPKSFILGESFRGPDRRMVDAKPPSPERRKNLKPE